MKIGLMGAFDKEVEAIEHSIVNPQTKEIAGRVFTTGQINQKEVVCVFSKWGKVSAATTASILMTQYQVDSILFTGLAGSLNTSVKVGDIVIAKSCVQHDMDASPLMPKYEVPFTGKSYFETCPKLSLLANRSAQSFLKDSITEVIDSALLEEFQLNTPRVHQGTVLTGDTFVNDKQHANRLCEDLHEPLAVEMEGAAVAQVCHDFKVPFGLWRIISDDADATSNIDFVKFSSTICPAYTKGIVSTLLAKL